MRHAYMDRSKQKDKDGIVHGLEVTQVKHAGEWYRSPSTSTACADTDIGYWT